MSDDDSRRQAVQSNDLLSLGQLKLTVTVCPRCEAVYRSGGMDCHDTMSRLDVEWRTVTGKGSLEDPVVKTR